MIVCFGARKYFLRLHPETAYSLKLRPITLRQAKKARASSCSQEDARVRGDNDQHEKLCWNDLLRLRAKCEIDTD